MHLLGAHTTSISCRRVLHIHRGTNPTLRWRQNEQRLLNVVKWQTATAAVKEESAKRQCDIVNKRRPKMFCGNCQYQFGLNLVRHTNQIMQQATSNSTLLETRQLHNNSSILHMFNSEQQLFKLQNGKCTCSSASLLCIPSFSNTWPCFRRSVSTWLFFLFYTYSSRRITELTLTNLLTTKSTVRHDTNGWLQSRGGFAMHQLFTLILLVKWPLARQEFELWHMLNARLKISRPSLVHTISHVL